MNAKFLLSLILFLPLSASSIAEEETKPIKTSAMFELMSNQVVTELCKAPEFQACFDVPLAECSHKLREIMSDCHRAMVNELPELIKATDADPVIAKVYGCVVPRWAKEIESRRTNSQACKEIEDAVEGVEETS